MKNMILLLGSLLYLIYSKVCAGSQKIAVAADQWCPYFCKAGLENDGFSVELLREALKQSGLEDKYINASFSRITFQVENGTWQIHGATDSNFTPNLLIGKEAVAYSKWVFVSKKSSQWKYQGTQSLKGKIFAKVKGYVYSTELTEYYNRPENQSLVFNITADAPQKQFLKMLSTGRVDIIVEDESVVRYWAAQLGMADKMEISGVDSEQVFYPAYKKSDVAALALSEKVDMGLRSVKKNKKFMNQLFKKYEISNWK